MSSGKNRAKLVFFGNERLVSGLKDNDNPILSMLIEQGYHVAAVVAHHGDTRSRNGRPLEIAQLADTHGIPIFTPQKPLDIYDELANLHAEAAILVAYGRIIPQKLIDLFPRGIINIHPSLLPKYRGPTPIESPILNGDEETGVSIMNLSAQMDAGDIYAQESFDIEPTDIKFDIYNKAIGLSVRLLSVSLPGILDGSLPPMPQDESKVSYCQLLDKSDGKIDWREPAVIIERKIRAFLEWPQSRTRLGDLEIIITVAHVVDSSGQPGSYSLDGGQLVVFAGEKALSIDRLKPLGKKEMPIQAFLAGYRDKL